MFYSLFVFSGARSRPAPLPKPKTIQNLSLADQLALRGTDLKAGSKRGPPPPSKSPEPLPEPLSLLDQIRAGKNLKKADERELDENPKVDGGVMGDLEDALEKMTGVMNYSSSEDSDSNSDSDGWSES